MQEKVLAAAMRTLVDILKAMLGLDADSQGARTLPPLTRSDLDSLEVRWIVSGFPPCELHYLTTIYYMFPIYRCESYVYSIASVGSSFLTP